VEKPVTRKSLRPLNSFGHECPIDRTSNVRDENGELIGFANDALAQIIMEIKSCTPPLI
jgi:hypothetical protein